MIHIVLIKPEIPPNTGNIIRLCANTGYYLHLVKPLGFDMSDRNLIRAGLDYHDLATVSMYENWSEFEKDITIENIAYLSTKGDKNIWDVELKKYTHFVFGPESIGLPKDILENSNNTLTIPMNSDSRSINLANAVSIVSYEYLRQNYEE